MKPQFSVYFVAFDGEESGCRGSQEFIYSHIKPHLEATGAQAQGAYILDTLLNYDKRPGSQGFSKVHYFLTFPAYFRFLNHNNFFPVRIIIVLIC